MTLHVRAGSLAAERIEENRDTMHRIELLPSADAPARSRSCRLAPTLLCALVAALASVGAVACGTDGDLFDDGNGSTGSGGAAGEGGGAGGETNAGGGGGETGAGGAGGSTEAGPVVRIHVRATTEPFDHQDGLSGQTPAPYASGLRKFQLFRDAEDPDPVTVFDYGSGFVEASYEDGADTVVGTVPAKSLAAGHFKMGRTVHSHVRYRVAATLHYADMKIPGHFENLHVLSDGTEIDGKTYDHGHYEFVFDAGGKEYPQSGENGPIPEYSTGGGFSVKLENGEWAYTYPLDLYVDPNVTDDVDMVMELNVYESFRWEDTDEDGYEAGVFDVTPTKFEPVKKFGASSFEVYAE